ncbi:MAG TPA: transposase [Phycisphaerae bacterium]|jgi:transposase-like protein
MNQTRKERKNYTAEEKVAILRRHLIEHVPVSQLCEEYQLGSNVFYRWQQLFFENGAAAFRSDGKASARQQDARTRRIEALEAKVRQKDEVLVELMHEHVALKKSLGEA